jgi:hypothetical protein
MRISYGSREVDLPEPSPEELRQLIGLPTIGESAKERLLAMFRAGAVATLQEIENTRGARLEAAYWAKAEEFSSE